MHQIVFNNFLYQTESLALHFQLMDHGTFIDLTPSFYTKLEGAPRKQAFTIEGTSYALCLNGIKIHTKMHNRVREDYKNLPTYELTSFFSFDHKQNKV